jgi:peptidoglycan/xylan/chitin deacetylase (PgdA/CDA1 family)
MADKNLQVIASSRDGVEFEFTDTSTNHLTPGEPQTISKTDISVKYPIHLTFDDGPHLTLTPKVLDILKDEDVKATFFVLGERFAGGKANLKTLPLYKILDRAKKEGHTIGSHTYSHIDHQKYNSDKIRENISKPNNLLKEYLSPVLRLPYGSGAFPTKNPVLQKKNKEILDFINFLGFTNVLWDIDSNDWNENFWANLSTKLLEDIRKKKGGLVLFHDVQKHTVSNLNNWIKAIKSENHLFKSLDFFIPNSKLPLPQNALDYH